MKLSTAQVRTLEEVAALNAGGKPYVPPKGSGCRPAKFLRNSGLIDWRESQSLPVEIPGGLWLTATGTAELARQKGGSPPC